MEEIKSLEKERNKLLRAKSRKEYEIYAINERLKTVDEYLSKAITTITRKEILPDVEQYNFSEEKGD